MRNCQKTCLIIPCYDEEKRLNIKAFSDVCSENLMFVFVDDGSTDNTKSMLMSHSSDNWHVLSLEKNRGKGEAIRQGALYIKEKGIDQRITWFGFWDSDLSVPFTELDNFFAYANLFSSNSDCIIGSRVKRMGSNIERSAIRHYLGRGFCTIVSRLFDVQFYDTQCGAKLFKKELLAAAFDKGFVSKWIFDIELLIRLEEFEIIEYPLQEWIQKKGSKLKFSKAFYEVSLDLIKMKKRMSNSQ